jgi:hypothetical protein
LRTAICHHPAPWHTRPHPLGVEIGANRIAGFALKEDQFDGLYIGRQKGNYLIYAGKVDHGFDNALAKDLQARLKPLIRKTQPYAKKNAHRGVWVEPSLLAEIEYRAKPAAGEAIRSSKASRRTCDGDDAFDRWWDRGQHIDHTRQLQRSDQATAAEQRSKAHRGERGRPAGRPGQQLGGPKTGRLARDLGFSREPVHISGIRSGPKGFQ